ncbi:head GIN domain-containing protein [Gangjinia marincola]|uniref:Head GIN domain-containing protein n=1 Tax=Gangjinia marincola TaxID=578463 RepID=A0ABN1MIM6_9FLAO
MKKLSVLIIALAFVSTTQAQWWGSDKIKGNGKVITENRSTGDYDEVTLQGWMDVELVQGTEGKLVISGESNLLEYIETEVKGGELVIKQKKGVQLKPTSGETILIKVPVEAISGANVVGSGDMIGKMKLKADFFETSVTGSGDLVIEVEARDTNAKVTGSGDLSIKGSTKTLDCRVSGSGDLDARNLVAENVDAKVAGSGDISVHATQSLKASVAGSGDITYKGDPEMRDINKAGSGDVTKG